MRMLKKNPKLSLAAMLGLLAGMGVMPDRKPMHQMPKTDKPKPVFTPDEIAHLATLSGKDKKIYVKKLKEKYK